MIQQKIVIKKEITNDIRELWKEIFGDTDSYIDFFEESFSDKYKLYCTYEEEKLLSMFFLIDTSFTYGEKSYRSLYLYAAATVRSHRGKGLFSKMFEKALSDNSDYDFVICVPAGEYLFNFYQKKGFETLFSRKVFSLPITLYKEKFNISKFDGNYERLYGIYLKNRNQKYNITRDFDFFKKCIIAGNFDIYYIENDKGYMLVSNEKVYDICEKEDHNNTSVPFIFCKRIKDFPDFQTQKSVYECILLD